MLVLASDVVLVRIVRFSFSGNPCESAACERWGSSTRKNRWRFEARSINILPSRSPSRLLIRGIRDDSHHSHLPPPSPASRRHQRPLPWAFPPSPPVLIRPADQPRASPKSCIFILSAAAPASSTPGTRFRCSRLHSRPPSKPVATSVPGMRISESTPGCRPTPRTSALDPLDDARRGNISNHFDADTISSAARRWPSRFPATWLHPVEGLPWKKRTGKNIPNYVWLIRCVGDPVFCAPNIGSGGHLGASQSPLFVGSATNHPAMPGFRPPEEFQATLPPERLLLWPTASRPASPPPTRPREPDDATWSDIQHRAFELARAPGEGRAASSRCTASRKSYAIATACIRLARTCSWPAWSRPASASSRSTAGPAPPPARPAAAPASSWDMHGSNSGMGMPSWDRLVRHGLVLAMSR